VLLAVNRCNKAVLAKFTVTGEGNTRVREHFEAKQLSVSNGSFEQEFAGYAVHVYDLE
jgi:hypothetical protein